MSIVCGVSGILFGQDLIKSSLSESKDENKARTMVTEMPKCIKESQCDIFNASKHGNLQAVR